MRDALVPSLLLKPCLNMIRWSSRDLLIVSRNVLLTRWSTNKDFMPPISASSATFMSTVSNSSGIASTLAAAVVFSFTLSESSFVSVSKASSINLSVLPYLDCFSLRRSPQQLLESSPWRLFDVQSLRVSKLWSQHRLLYTNCRSLGQCFVLREWGLTITGLAPSSHMALAPNLTHLRV